MKLCETSQGSHLSILELRWVTTGCTSLRLWLSLAEDGWHPLPWTLSVLALPALFWSETITSFYLISRGKVMPLHIGGQLALDTLPLM